MSDEAPGPRYDALVDQARAMVSTQSNCTLDDALAWLSEIAAATDETLEAIAELVVSGEIRFDAS